MKNKNPKRKMAIKMLTRIEIKNHTPIFDSIAWTKRKKSKELKNKHKEIIK